MNITIVGGGNIGTQFAVHCAEKHHKVIVYTSRPEVFANHISIVNNDNRITHQGVINLATSDPEIAFNRAEVIIVTFPPSMMDKAAEEIYQYASSKAIIGVVPGNGGGECAFKKCIERGNIFFGIERVPAIARLLEKGKIVKSIGYRDELHVAAIPSSNAAKCAELVQNIFGIKTKIIPSFLNLTLTPSNPILHTTRLRTLFHDWKEGVIYTSVPLFYEEWNDKSSELLLACDEEVQKICHSLPEYDLQYVKSLKIHYESFTPAAMTKKISSIDAFKGLKTPTVSVDGGVIPDLHSRYFTADFSYGLTIIRQVGKIAGVSTPYIDETMAWYKEIEIEKNEFRYADYGIITKDDFRCFYLM